MDEGLLTDAEIQAIAAMMEACGGESMDVTVRKAGDIWPVLRVDKDITGQVRVSQSVQHVDKLLDDWSPG